MEITDVRAYKVKEKKNSVLGYASITIDGCFAVRNLQIVESKEGNRFIGFPTRKDEKSETGYSDVAFPVTAEARELITSKVLEAFDNIPEE